VSAAAINLRPSSKGGARVESGEFIEPTTRARRSLLALYAAVAIAFALLVFVVRPALLAFCSPPALRGLTVPSLVQMR
jgi:hypothetical protein